MILHISSIKVVGSWATAAAAAVLVPFLLAGRIIQPRFSVVVFFLFTQQSMDENQAAACCDLTKTDGPS